MDDREIIILLPAAAGHAVAQLVEALRTNQKDPSSIADGVITIFH
jgi:hypothetical protein